MSTPAVLFWICIGAYVVCGLLSIITTLINHFEGGGGN